jgi:hypothetical protein
MKKTIPAAMSDGHEYDPYDDQGPCEVLDRGSRPARRALLSLRAAVPPGVLYGMARLVGGTPAGEGIAGTPAP